MKKTNKFIIVFLATILIIRLILYFIPRTNIIYVDKIHHIYLGLALLIIYILMKKHLPKLFLAIILGIIADQISSSPFYISNLFNKPIAPVSFWRYWSPYSLISTTIITILSIILIKKYIKEVHL